MSIRMILTMSGRIILLTLLILNALVADGQDWPQFRGPAGQGHSSENALPWEWSETQNVGWKITATFTLEIHQLERLDTISAQTPHQRQRDRA